jgi:hypothetical protein
MTQFVIANNVNTQLAAAVASTATTLTLASATNLPALNTVIGQMMPLTLNDAATGAFYEIVYVTAISGVTLTVLRAQEGTGALNWSLGDYAYCAPTAGTVGLTTMRTQYPASAAYSSSETLTAAIAGQSIGFTGSSAATFSIPGQSTVPPLTPTAVYNDGSAALTITANGSDKFVTATGQVASLVMQPGDDLSFYASTTVGLWQASSGSALRQYEPLVVGTATQSNHATNMGQFAAGSNSVGPTTGTSLSVSVSFTPTSNGRVSVTGTGGSTSSPSSPNSSFSATGGTVLNQSVNTWTAGSGSIIFSDVGSVLVTAGTPVTITYTVSNGSSGPLIASMNYVLVPHV